MARRYFRIIEIEKIGAPFRESGWISPKNSDYV
jgi:hypothetical protein